MLSGFVNRLSGRFTYLSNVAQCVYAALALLALGFVVPGAAPGVLAASAIFPTALPAGHLSASHHEPRFLALGEQRFSDAKFYNLYDQGGSPMGMLELHQEKAAFGLDYWSNGRATSGDSLTLNRNDLAIPRVSFFQPGAFGASLYYQRESETYERRGGDSVETATNVFGLDMAMGPASGLFRVGFSAHARTGALEYPGGAKRMLIAVPSLRFDLGSRLHPAVEAGIFGGIEAQFDSLQSPQGHLERVASMNLPRYGALVDVGGTEDMPWMGNAVLELGTDRSFGEYRAVNDSGILYPTVWNGYWTFQTQWLAPFDAGDFRLSPAVRLAYRSESAQAYAGIKSNQNPLKKGAEIDSLNWTRSITSFGLGGQAAYQDIAVLMLEWETAGHSVKSDSTRDARYHRIAIGVENYVHKLPFSFPEGVSLALRAGWSWRHEGESQPGYRDFHFTPNLPSDLPGLRAASRRVLTDKPTAYSAFTLGFGLGLLEERLVLDGFLGFPKQAERSGLTTQEATGTEFRVVAAYRIF